jgi:hypothetical protein
MTSFLSSTDDFLDEIVANIATNDQVNGPTSTASTETMNASSSSSLDKSTSSVPPPVNLGATIGNSIEEKPNGRKRRRIEDTNSSSSSSDDDDTDGEDRMMTNQSTAKTSSKSFSSIEESPNESSVLVPMKTLASQYELPSEMQPLLTVTFDNYTRQQRWMLENFIRRNTVASLTKGDDEEDFDRPPHRVRVAYFDSFMLDYSGDRDLYYEADHAGNIREINDAPSYLLGSACVLPVQKSTHSTAAAPTPSKPRCFNCGSEGHAFNECPEARNETRIRQSRQEFRDTKPVRIISERRYHADETERERMSGRFKPGTLSDELKRALDKFRVEA